MRKYLALSIFLFASPALAQEVAVIRPAVQGPSSATSGHIATYSGTSGQIIQDGGVVPTSAPCSAFGTTSGTCAQGGVVTAGGPTGSATVAPIITYNAAGQITALTSATITPAIGSVTGLGTGVATALGHSAGGASGFALLGSANSGNLLFTDATYDIGASGATRPRNIFLSGAVNAGTAVVAGGNITAGATAGVNWTGHAVMTSPADGEIIITNNAASAGANLLFGGAAAGNVGLFPSGTLLVAALGNFSDFAPFKAATLTLPDIALDTGQTDRTACVTSAGLFLTGTGTLGICLGTSSARYKTGIKPVLTISLPKIMQIEPDHYRYKKGYGDNGARENYWLVAEKVQKVLPQCVPLDHGGQPSTVDPICVETFMLKAMQEEERQITDLRAANDNLARQFALIMRHK